jgi:multisubunit Na+/H+ antiporter MnhE subunit
MNAGRYGRFILAWLGLVALWLLIVGQLAPAEIAAGAAAAAISVFVFAAVRRDARQLRIRPDLAWLLESWRLPLRVIVDFVTITRALWNRLVRNRRARGSFRTIPLSAVGTDGRSTARRVLATLALSLPPNSYVVAFDPDDRSMVVHTLVPERFQDLELLRP